MVADLPVLTVPDVAVWRVGSMSTVS